MAIWELRQLFHSRVSLPVASCWHHFHPGSLLKTGKVAWVHSMIGTLFCIRGFSFPLGACCLKNIRWICQRHCWQVQVQSGAAVRLSEALRGQWEGLLHLQSYLVFWCQVFLFPFVKHLCVGSQWIWLEGRNTDLQFTQLLLLWIEISHFDMPNEASKAFVWLFTRPLENHFNLCPSLLLCKAEE